MSYEINSAVELSSEELDLVAGGANVLDQRATQFTSNQLVFAGTTNSGPTGSQTGSLVATNQINTAAAELLHANS
jgi:hypothetical protein